MKKNRAGFDTERYLKIQKEAIEKRLNKFSGRLYLEFGGKLLDDFHAARTLPGYDPNAKLRLLKSLKKNLGILFCVSAKQLVSRKVRGDFGIGYDLQTIKDIERLKSNGLDVMALIINRYDGEKEAENFERRIKNMGIEVHKRREIKGYPKDLNMILSDQGYGADDYVETDKPLVVVLGAGPGSGKLSTCLGQIYLDKKRGISSGYAKFETFPVWDLPLNHPVNTAYEAATADLGDFNLVDPFHFGAYGKKVVNYNRDVESFPILKANFEMILDKDNFSRTYKSPTDMGFNRLKEGIVDDAAVREAGKREINYYLFRYREEYKKGLVGKEVLERMKEIMERIKVKEDYLPTIAAARKARQEATKQENKGERGVYCGAAMELKNGKLIIGKNSPLLHAEAAMVLNAIKELAGIADDLELISPLVIKQIGKLKDQIGEDSFSLDCSETLLALAASTNFNPLAVKAQTFLSELKDCFVHTTHRLSLADGNMFRKLGMWVSTDGEVA